MTPFRHQRFRKHFRFLRVYYLDFQIYDDISKKQRRQVLPAIHTRGEDDENLAKSSTNHLHHDNLVLDVFEYLKS